MFLNPPKNWYNKNFHEKLRNYSYVKDLENLKAIYSDKFRAKQIIQKYNIPDLYYAKLVQYITSQSPNKYSTRFTVPLAYDFSFNYDCINYFINTKISKAVVEPKTNYSPTGAKYCPIVLIKKPNKLTLLQNKEIVKVNTVLILPECNKNTNETFKIILSNNTCSDDLIQNYSSNYLIKVNIGWNTFILITNNKIQLISSKNPDNYSPLNLKTNYESYKKWYKIAKKQYDKNPYSSYTKFIVFGEEFIGFNLKVYEFYCIFGVPHILSVYYKTLHQDFENNFIIDEDETFNPINHNVGQKSIQKENLKLDLEAMKKMIKFCKILGENIDFVRIDFYYTHNKIYFSEFTFKPYNLKKNNTNWGPIGQHLSSKWNYGLKSYFND